MATTQAITNKAVGGRHLGPGGLTGVFKQQPAVTKGSISPKEYTHNSCGATVTLQSNTYANAVIMARGECGLSGVVCADCMALSELMGETTDEPGLAMRG
jgi:hypothetical protein